MHICIYKHLIYINIYNHIPCISNKNVYVCMCVCAVFKSGINAEAVQKMEKNTTKKKSNEFLFFSIFLAFFLIFFFDFFCLFFLQMKRVQQAN